MVTNGKGENGNGSKKREETARRITAALEECHGLLTLTAKRTGIGYRTVCRYAAEYPSVAQAVRDAKEVMLDEAESQLFRKIREGDNVAILFYLKCNGKSRGYIERTEISGEIKANVTWKIGEGYATNNNDRVQTSK